MSTFSVFVIGLIVGWLVEWMIDFLFWRRGGDGAEANLQSLRDQLTAAEAQANENGARLAATQESVGKLQRDRSHLENRVLSLQDELETTAIAQKKERSSFEERLAALQAQLEAALAREPEVVIKEVFREKDQLQKIKGIGAVFAQRLNEAGIFTFAQIAEADPDWLEMTVEAKEWQDVHAEEWVEEATQIVAAKGDASA